MKTPRLQNASYHFNSQENEIDYVLYLSKAVKQLSYILEHIGNFIEKLSSFEL